MITHLRNGREKVYKITQIFEDGSNCKNVRPGVSASAVLAKYLQAPSVIMNQQRHSLVNFNVEELVELPIPPENRFWLENLSDGKYVVINELKQQLALSFEYGRFFETGHLTDFKVVKPPHSEINSNFLMDVHLWLSKYHHAIAEI